MTIEYKNVEGGTLSTQQVNFAENFNKVFSENDAVKKVEEYRNRELSAITYYRDDSENETDLVNLLSVFSQVPFSIAKTNYVGSKKVERFNYYDLGQLVGKSNQLYDQANELITSEHIDITTNSPIYTDTTKYLYDRGRSPDTCLYRFFYNEDGSLWYAEYKHDDPYDSEHYEACDFPKIKHEMGLTDEEMNYYLTADFEP